MADELEESVARLCLSGPNDAVFPKPVDKEKQLQKSREEELGIARLTIVSLAFLLQR